SAAGSAAGCPSPPAQQGPWQAIFSRSVGTSSSFLRHYDEAPTLLKSQPQICAIGADGEHYEGNDYLLIGVAFLGATTKPGGSGDLFNGRFTSRSETMLLGESNIRMEIDESNKNVMYRYPIGEDGEPIAARQVRSVRCVSK
ncbi:MAG: hypothetical protein ACOY7T_10550, partial [Pseudomonadota bacterium]